MIKITKTIETREITEEEFRKQKGVAPYKQLRNAAKGVNFLCIFGGSAKVLSENKIEEAWSKEQVEDFIEANDGLKEELKKADKQFKGESSLRKKYLAASMKIVENFFKGYPGLQNRIDREREYAALKGYCRTPFGMTRNFIQLKLRGSADDKEMSGALHNLNNIAANFGCQNMEACIRGRAQAEMELWLEKRGMKSRTVNEIHDSSDWYIAKDELYPAMAHLKHLDERKVPELINNWIPLPVDVEIADLADPNHGDTFKHGRAYVEFDEHPWETLHLEDPDPFQVELTEEFELEYFEARKKHWAEMNQVDPLARDIQKYLAKSWEERRNHSYTRDDKN